MNTDFFVVDFNSVIFDKSNFTPMQKILFCLLLIVASSTYGQTYNKLIPDKDISDFINWKLINDTFKNGNVPKKFFNFNTTIIKWRPVELKYDSTKSKAENEGRSIYNPRTRFLDSILSLKDKEFIIRQSNSYITNEWTFDIESDIIEKENYKYYYTLPLFSLDKQYAILKEVYYCGQTCGEERTILYQHTNKGWIWYKWLTGGVY